MDVMLDLETFGTRPGSVILSIGARQFSRAGIGADFYRVISVATCQNAGLTTDPDTIAWWAGQSERARMVVDSATAPVKAARAVSLGSALAAFAGWLAALGPTSETRIWGNGSDFDNAILGEAYIRAGFSSTPWSPFNNRCYRTLKNLRPDVKIVRSGTHHNALDDATDQAAHAVLLMAALGMEPAQ